MQYPTGLIVPNSPGQIFFKISGLPVYITPPSSLISIDFSFRSLVHDGLEDK